MTTPRFPCDVATRSCGAIPQPALLCDTVTRARRGFLSLLCFTLSLIMSALSVGCSTNPCFDSAQFYGKLKRETICYLDGKIKHGMHTKWYPKSDHKAFERTYRDDALDGVYREWYSNGQIKVEAYYKQGKLEGSYKKWYMNGQERLKGYYADNIRTGAYYEYYKNGKPRTEYTFNPLGQHEGKQLRYRKNGFRLSEFTYYQGKLVGKRFWSSNGMLDPVISQR